jgi:hypothetical protein
MENTTDWDQRQLCPDGGCLGVIGGDGTCSVCGRAAPNWGDERRRGKRNTDEVEVEVAANVVKHDLPEAPADFEDRALCPDGSCIGVIGDDGKCRACGRAAE